MPTGQIRRLPQDTDDPAGDWAVDGAALRRLRQAQGLSQEELARRSGVRQQHISVMERRTTHARLATVMHLAEALGVELAELVDGPAALPAAERPTPDLVEAIAAVEVSLEALAAQINETVQVLRELRGSTQAVWGRLRQIKRAAILGGLTPDGRGQLQEVPRSTERGPRGQPD